MKTVEDMAKNVLRRMDEYHAQKQRKKQVAMRVAVPAACCCLIALMSVGVWQGGLFAVSEMPTESGAPTDNPGLVLMPETSVSTSGTATTDNSTTAQTAETPTEKSDATTAKTTATADKNEVVPFLALYAEKAKAGGNETVLQVNEQYPFHVYLHMVSKKGLSPAQSNALFEECVAKAKQYVFKYTGTSGGHSVYTTQDDYIVATAFTDLFRVNIRDKQQFKQLRVYNTATYGQMEIHGSTSPKDGRPLVMPQGQDVVVTKAMAEERGGYAYQELDVVSFAWEPTDDATKLMYGKDVLDYTDFNDTIYIEIEYEDGTKTTGSVKLVFDESGEATVLCGDYSLFMP